MPVEQARASLEKPKADEAFCAEVMAEEDVEARVAVITAESFDGFFGGLSYPPAPEDDAPRGEGRARRSLGENPPRRR